MHGIYIVWLLLNFISPYIINMIKLIRRGQVGPSSGNTTSWLSCDISRDMSHDHLIYNDNTSYYLIHDFRFCILLCVRDSMTSLGNRSVCDVFPGVLYPLPTT